MFVIIILLKVNLFRLNTVILSVITVILSVFSACRQICQNFIKFFFCHQVLVKF